MISIVGDTHTHTLSSGHAYSTLMENAMRAKELGHRFMALTDHGPALPGAPAAVYFSTMRLITDEIYGVKIIRGVEANIVDYDGSLDLSDKMLRGIDWVIASFHGFCVEPGSFEDRTRAWISIARNPLVDVIGHCGEEKYSFDHIPVIQEFSRNGKVVEINSHSFVARVGSERNCPIIAGLCAEYGVPIVISSDAHFAGRVGEVSAAVSMLESINFPEELILNADYDRFMRFTRDRDDNS